MVTLDCRDLTAYYAQRGWRRIGGDEVDGEDVVVYDWGRADNGAWRGVVDGAARGSEQMGLILVCEADNDLFGALGRAGVALRHASSPAGGLAVAAPGDGVLILAGGYPAELTPVDQMVFEEAASRGVRLYVEFPAWLPGIEVGPVGEARWERGVVASDALSPRLERLRILALHGCRYVAVPAAASHIVLARVAGFDHAVYGLPEQTAPILFEHPDGPILVATTKLSQAITGRFGPTDAWGAIWDWIVAWACPDFAVPQLVLTPTVRPSYGADAALPVDVEEQAIRRGVGWTTNARLLIHPAWQAEAERRLETLPDGTGAGPDPDWPVGDGRLGMIEGASARIHPDGTQDWRYHVRNDCIGETSMAMAFGSTLLRDVQAGRVAANLNDFIYTHSVFAQGPRADPGSPSYGLLSWTTQPPADGVYYGDDNARSMLGTIAAAALLGSDRWDLGLMRCLLANLRTTGPLGFRGWRLDEAKLQANGWRYYWESERTHFAPHYESWLWACFLWAYRQTAFAPFLERAVGGIRATIAAYPNAWRWTNGIQQERARMLLPLAWLVRLQDTDEHRGWLRCIAEDLLALQDPCGAIREEVGSEGLGSYAPPESNEAYGTSEAPLIQQNGDPLCDLLYTSNFALVGLHEAAATTGERLYREAGDRLAAFLCRIQVRSETHPELDGGWFRAFDFRRWDYWASNADEGWGAWSIESGWTQAWITSVLALRQMGTSLWELTAGSRIAEHLDAQLPVLLPGVAKGEATR